MYKVVTKLSNGDLVSCQRVPLNWCRDYAPGVKTLPVSGTKLLCFVGLQNARDFGNKYWLARKNRYEIWSIEVENAESCEAVLLPSSFCMFWQSATEDHILRRFWADGKSGYASGYATSPPSGTVAVDSITLVELVEAFDLVYKEVLGH